MTDWWEYPTNFSNGDNVAGPADMFFNYPSYLLDSKFGIGITMIIWLMIFTLSLSAGSRKALGIASIVSGIISIYFAQLGWFNILTTFTLIIVGILSLIFSRDEGVSI
jgi:hypothetical protein